MKVKYIEYSYITPKHYEYILDEIYTYDDLYKSLLKLLNLKEEYSKLIVDKENGASYWEFTTPNGVITAREGRIELIDKEWCIWNL